MSAMVWTMRDVLTRKRRKNLVPRDATPWWMRVLAAFFWVAAIVDLRTSGPTWMSPEMPPRVAETLKVAWVIMAGLLLGLAVFTLFFQLLTRRIMKELDEESVTTRSAWRSEAVGWAAALFSFGTQRSWPIAVVGLLVSVCYWLRTPGGDVS